MRTMVILVLLVFPIGAAAWWFHPDDRIPEMQVFRDGGRSLSREAAILSGTAIRWAGVRRMLPGWAVLVTAALTAGLFIREGRSYASPTLAWLGKRAAFAAPVMTGLFVLAPITQSWLFPLGAGAAGLLGLTVYVGNLPRRL